MTAAAIERGGDDAPGANAATIRLAGTDMSFVCADGDSLLRAGLRAGLALPYECNSGGCGNCKVELVAGDVEVLWSGAPALTERDRARRRILGCQSRPLGPCTIKARLIDAYRPPIRPERFEARLLASVDLTHDIREFRFATDRPRAFLPGQYALLELPRVPGLRAYSMSNVDGGDEWQFEVRRVPGGKGTAQLFDALRPGDRIAIDGPYGHAWLRTEAPRDLVCVAGGSGLSPMLSIARGVARSAALRERRLHFFHGGRGPRDVCGESLLREMTGLHERLDHYAAISMPELDTAREWKGEVGFVHDIVARTLGDRLASHEIYFAGPPAMTQAVEAMLVAHGVPPAQMHVDRFY